MMLATVNDSHAMAEQTEEIVIDPATGCGEATGEDQYAYEGELPGGFFAGFRMSRHDNVMLGKKVTRMSFNLTYPPTLTAIGYAQQPTGGKVGELWGYSKEGFAMYWVPNNVRFLAIYFAPNKQNEPVNGKLEVCLSETPY